MLFDPQGRLYRPWRGRARGVAARHPHLVLPLSRRDPAARRRVPRAGARFPRPRVFGPARPFRPLASGTGPHDPRLPRHPRNRAGDHRRPRYGRRRGADPGHRAPRARGPARPHQRSGLRILAHRRHDRPRQPGMAVEDAQGSGGFRGLGPGRRDSQRRPPHARLSRRHRCPLRACPRFDVVGKHWGDGEWSCRDFGGLAHGWLPSGAWRGEGHDWSRRLMALGRRRAWPGCGRCRSSPIRM